MSGRGRGGRGRRGGGLTFINAVAKDMKVAPGKLRKTNQIYEPEPTYPKFVLARPTHLHRDEVSAVRYYQTLRTKIMEDTPFYITVRKRPAEDDEDDGITRYRDKYKPEKRQRQSLRGFPTDETFFPDELKSVIQGGGTALGKKHIKKYNLDDFLDVTYEEETFEQPEDEPTGLQRADIIHDPEEDDELEPGARDADADEDLEEDDYGEDYFDNGEGDYDDYAEGGDDEN